ncbi:hypothetical protein ZWY2020_051823 [Hordeum vulgare]|nr:hypothetical protein ZWY2020_051823 [Hordeum vulgare]
MREKGVDLAAQPVEPNVGLDVLGILLNLDVPLPSRHAAAGHRLAPPPPPRASGPCGPVLSVAYQLRSVLSASAPVLHVGTLPLGGRRRRLRRAGQLLLPPRRPPP